MPTLLKLAQADRLDVIGPITQRFTLDQAAEAYQLLHARKIVGRAIVDVETP